ncbi:alpha-D-ribose 1-methylphosphonate 5-phosphate C-P-lyase PhnJ [Candidatus Oscillochloris fontis]|uniref:alpha-D-ribose 1-methylphosphonate 5-phosphate C-P-lyase PhnJ n=1 Tax=Candidatus Oscillochloris fontis TaxID=2496868 RepID=UPI00101CAD39|nr:alpha-D-ribose 1-methylphosphonate 5-phosphate C-P-lyase PhnJ [Candidatus Oscillochloris fontis]
MSLQQLAHPRHDYSYAFLDEFAKRELRRRILKAIAIPGYQVPYASRELPMARGWGTGGLQVTLAAVGPTDTVKVIDQGADDSVNAANLRRFIARMAGVQTTTDVLAATIIQSRHRIPEERLREGQLLVLQVPVPEPLTHVEPSVTRARQMHADADYALIWLELHEQLVRYRTFTGGADYPVVVHGRYLMAPSPIPRWDTPMLHQAAHLTLLSAGREKRLYAVPPYTDVRPIEFEDVHFQVENQAGRVCAQTGAINRFMNEVPQPDGSSRYILSDTGYAAKLVQRAQGEGVEIGATYYDDQGRFYHTGFLHHDD